MEGVPYDPSRCIKTWFRLVQSRYLAWPLSAGMRVECLEVNPRPDGGTLTFPQEIRWPATRVSGEDHVFEINAAIPVPIVSHDQVLFVSLRDRWDRVVARVHITYTDARTLSRGGFRQWYPAEPAPKMGAGEDDGDIHGKTNFDALAKYERTTFRLVHFLDGGDLYAHPLEPAHAMHPSRVLVSSEIDQECLNWAAAVTRDNPWQILLAGAFLLPVQAILLDTDEKTVETTTRSRTDFENGFFLANVLLCDPRATEYDKIYLALEYASGNMCAIDVPSLEDNDDYTRLHFPDSSASVYRTAVDKVGALLAVLRRIDRPGWNPAVIVTMDMEHRRSIEAGMVKEGNRQTRTPETVVVLSNRKSCSILLAAWLKTSVTQATTLTIFTRWRQMWKRRSVSFHSEVWSLCPSALASSPHAYRVDDDIWRRIFLPALLATTTRRLSPFFQGEAINEITRAVSDRRARGESGGYIPLGHDITRAPPETTAVGIQRGFHDAVAPGLAAARQVRGEQTRYAAFW